MFRKEAVNRGMTMLDVDNNPSKDVPDEMISKGRDGNSFRKPNLY